MSRPKLKEMSSVKVAGLRELEKAGCITDEQRSQLKSHRAANNAARIRSRKRGKEKNRII